MSFVVLSDPNPFALVVLAHLQSKESNTDARRLETKLRLLRLLSERGYAREDTIALLKFIDWTLRLPPSLEVECRLRAFSGGKDSTVPYVTSWERMAEEKGLQQGENKGLLKGIEVSLRLKFGENALELLPRIAQLADVARLRAFLDSIPGARTLADLEATLPVD